MSRVRAIIADDERNVRDDLARMLARLWPELEIVAVADNGAQALNLLEGLAPDVAFLDIRMPISSGMEVAQAASSECKVVFVTAFDNYALEAFDHAATDYLLKPVDEQRLKLTIARLKSALTMSATGNYDGAAATSVAVVSEAVAQHTSLRWLRVSQGEAVVILSLEEVIYFRAEDKYTTVVTRERSYLMRTPIQELVQQLDPALFWQIHRGIIVNARHIQHVHKGLNGTRILTLKERRETLTSSRSYRHLFEQM